MTSHDKSVTVLGVNSSNAWPRLRVSGAEDNQVQRPPRLMKDGPSMACGFSFKSGGPTLKTLFPFLLMQTWIEIVYHHCCLHDLNESECKQN